jgi:magnesium-transporting ATPase (P-type)
MVKSKDKAKLKSRWGGIETVAKELRTSLRDGLKGDDLPTRRAIFGENRTPEPPHASWFELFFEAFQDVAVIILSIAAIVALVAGLLEQFLLAEEGHQDQNWIEGVAILAAVLIVATVTATNDYMKDIQFRKLKKQSADRKIRVIRNGEEHAISIFDVVVGDIVLLFRGDQIPVDGFLIQGLEDLNVDESSLTGEPEAQIKSEKKPFLFSGTFVSKGSGRMLTTSVGSQTEWGRTLALLADEHGDTPLQEKLEELVVLIGKVGTGVATVVFIVLCGYYIANFVVDPHDIVTCVDVLPPNPTNETLCRDGIPIPGQDHQVMVPGKWHPESLMNILKAFIIAVTIVVVAVPEGLPLAVTISLAYSVSQMAEDQNLVRHLSACETMGGATNICSDKTGTLTENRMTVVELWVAGHGFSVHQLQQNQQSSTVNQLLIEGITLNNDDGELEKSEERIKFLGNVTECALLVLAEKLGVDYKKLQKANPPVHKWGFTSARKRMSSIIRKDDSYRL